MLLRRFTFKISSSGTKLQSMFTRICLGIEFPCDSMEIEDIFRFRAKAGEIFGNAFATYFSMCIPIPLNLNEP